MKAAAVLGSLLRDLRYLHTMFLFVYLVGEILTRDLKRAK